MTTPDGANSTNRAHSLEAMLDAITDYAIMQLDLDGRVARWGTGAEIMFGYPSAEVVGQPITTLYTPEDVADHVVDKELAATRRFGRFELEGWRVRKDGHRFRAGVIVSAIRDGNDHVVGFVKVVRDAGAERQKASDTFQALLESAPDAMVIVGPDGRILIANAQADKIFGYSREELVGSEVEMLVPQRFRERHVRNRADFFSSPFTRQMGTGTELWGLRNDGTEFPIEVSLSPLHIDQTQYTSASIRDITERRESEQRLRRQHAEIMELSTPVIQVWDKVLTLPLIGTLDSVRAARLTENLLAKISETQAEVVIFDISGVPTIDTLVAQHLLRTVQAAALMGTVSIMSGVRPETAQAMVHLGIDLGQLLSRATLQDALQLALQLLSERAESTRSATKKIRRSRSS